ncbi:uncharacterized protein STEHIDRAFT_124307 [Stereum hirsutum FP-91666 SS1]|uniref:uncharacterized protein n=1 Tax=Stereum hirsutum (strain FP-91666) TaxID=721885 RepID=UPI00044494FB|nr:uncharacterized protein STEHIDRAFT_124307 [Stereum hirsutum FP-91666 SS1]EIM82990.1 hypothetical protein STEHIDRAFT_124307 [Stereum hirsutum FP-91666 SS1]
MGRNWRWYIIIAGTRPGIYREWAEAGPKVVGIPGSIHKGYMTYAEALRAFQKEIAEGNIRTIRVVTVRDQYLPEDPRTYHYPDIVDDSPSATTGSSTLTVGAGPVPSTSSARTTGVAGHTRDAPVRRETPSTSGTRRSNVNTGGDARDARNNAMASSPEQRRPLEPAATWPQNSVSQPEPSSPHRPNSQRSTNNGDRTHHRRTATLPSTPSTSGRPSARASGTPPHQQRSATSVRSRDVDHNAASSPIPITRQSTERILSPRRSGASDSTSSSPPTDVTQYGPDHFPSRSPSPASSLAGSPVLSRHGLSQREDASSHILGQDQTGAHRSPISSNNSQETEIQDESRLPVRSHTSTPSRDSSQESPPLPIPPRQTRSFIARAGSTPSALNSSSRAQPLRAHSSMPEPSRSHEGSSSAISSGRVLLPSSIVSSPTSLSAPPSTGRISSLDNRSTRSTRTRERLRLSSTSTTTPSHVPLPLSPSLSISNSVITSHSGSSSGSSPSTRRLRTPGTPFYPVIEPSDRELPRITPGVTPIATPLETRGTSPQEPTSMIVPPSTNACEPTSIGSPPAANSVDHAAYQSTTLSPNTSSREPTSIGDPPSPDLCEPIGSSRVGPTTSVSPPPSTTPHEPPIIIGPPVADNLEPTTISSPLPTPVPSADFLSPVTPSLGLTNMVTGVTDALTPRLNRLGLSWGAFFSQPAHVPNVVVDPRQDPRSPMSRSASLPGYGGLR